MELFKIFGTLGLQGKDAFNKDIDTASSKGTTLATKFGNGLKTVAKFGVALGAAAAAAGTAVIGMANSAAAAGDNIDKMSQKIGISREAYQELDFICSQCGTSVDTLQMGLKTMTNQMQSASDGTKTASAMFDKLGVSIYDSTGALKNQEDMMWEVMSALQGMENQTEKAALATDLFGRSGSELMPLLNGASGSIEEMKQKAHELGLVLSDEFVNNSVAYTDTMDQLKRSIKSAGFAITSNFLPFIQKIADKMVQYMPTIQGYASVVSDKLGAAIEWASEKIQEFKDWCTDMGNYIGTKLQPIFDDLRGAFEKIKDALQPVIEKFTGYMTEGGFVMDITKGIMDAVTWLANAYDVVKTNIQTFIDTLPDYVTNGELVEDITSRIEEVIGWLSEKFTAVKEALQPYLDKLSEYVSSGQLAEDAANALITAYEGTVTAITNIVNGFKDAVNWCKEHETALLMAAIAVGTLATAIGAYIAVQAIKNAGGIVELAQLAATAVGVGALTVAETAHTVASTIAAAATTAFGAAMAFLTSPITLIILAIGALIAIVVLLVKNWDKVKEAALNVWEWIKNVWATVADWFKENVIDPLVNFFTGLWDGIVGIFSAIGQWFADKFNEAKNNAKNAWSNAKELFGQVWSKIQGAFSAVGSWFSEKFTAAKEAAANAFGAAKELFSGIWSDIKGVFSDAVNAGQKIVDDIKQGISNAWDGLTKWFNELWNKLFGNRKVDVSVTGSGGGGVTATPHANGLDYVPYDGYLASLHKGEMVIPAAESRVIRNGFSGFQNNAETTALLHQILDELRQNRDTVLKLDNRELGRVVRGYVNA